MAYVVTRPHGRFEIRESIHTPRGPRARSLANFAVLTDSVVESARARATRPFDAGAVRAAAARVAAARTTTPAAPPDGPEDDAVRAFVESSRRMARTLARPPTGPRPDPGETLIGLLGFADEIARFQPARTAEPLAFPPLARLADRTGTGPTRADRSGVTTGADGASDAAGNGVGDGAYA